MNEPALPIQPKRSIAFTTVKNWKANLTNQLRGYWAMGAEGSSDVSSPQSHKQQQLTPELSPGKDNFCQCSHPKFAGSELSRKKILCSYWNRFFCLFDRVVLNKRSWWKGLTCRKRSKVKLKVPPVKVRAAWRYCTRLQSIWSWARDVSHYKKK